MSTAYVIILVLALIGLIGAVEVLRKQQQDQATAKIRDEANGKLFTCLVGNDLKPLVTDVLLGGMVGAPAISAIRSGTFRPARAYFKEGEFVLEARDPLLVRVYNEEIRRPSIDVKLATIQPLSQSKRIGSSAKATAVAAVSFALVLFLLVAFQIGFDHPRIGVALLIACGGGALIAILFVLLPGILRSFRDVSLLVLSDSNGTGICMLALRPIHTAEARRVLELAGVRWVEPAEAS